MPSYKYKIHLYLNLQERQHFKNYMLFFKNANPIPQSPFLKLENPKNWENPP